MNRPRKLRPAVALWLLVGFLAGCESASRGAAQYGAPVRFSKERAVEFRDFSIRYRGERRVQSPVFRPGFVFQDFEVTDGSRTKTVSWSGGTGVIDSSSFEFAGKPYELELRGSVARDGWLHDDEMVVWPRPDFLRALEERRRRSAR